MSTPPDPADPRSQEDLEARAELEAQRPRAGNSAGLLWVALLVVVIALGYWWFSGSRGTAPAPAAPVIEAPGGAGESVSTPDASPATPAEPAAAPGPGPATARPQPRSDVPKTTRPLPADRAPVALASNQQPDYPASALRAGLEGSITVRIDVDSRGVPIEVEVVSRSGQRSRDLDRAVLSAARTWRFEPAIRDGKAAAASVVVPVEFRRQ